MDFEFFFYLLIAAIYILYQLAEARRSSSEQQPETPSDYPRSQEPERPLPSADPSARAPGDEMDEALREIRRALGMEPPAPPPSPEPAPEPEPVVAETPPRPEPTPVRKPSDLAPAPYSDDEWLQEETVEGLPEVMAPPMAPGATEPSPRRPAAPKRHADLVARLREPGSAREAVLLSEILGPPRAKNPLDRGRR